jgi:mono/diheme cytochrome c family protein
MGRLWRPILIGATVVAATFLLAQWAPFEPSTSATTTTEGNAHSGEAVFERECASCHGPGGEGGAGPRLVESGLDADDVMATIREGAGIMPPGLVEGQDEADVVAYVVSISTP